MHKPTTDIDTGLPDAAIDSAIDAADSEALMRLSAHYLAKRLRLVADAIIAELCAAGTDIPARRAGHAAVIRGEQAP